MIDYIKIAEAKKYYSDLGYIELEIPWLVDKEAYHATKPRWAADVVCYYEEGSAIENEEESGWKITTKQGYLEASGEQGFLQWMLEGKMPFGKFFCITPCFRQEAIQDEWHLPYFLKLELIRTDRVGLSQLYGMISDAANFYYRYLPVEVIETEKDTYDIVSANGLIELGSYGIRKYKQHSWVYGTGVAEPRLSQVLLKQE